jgi:anaerobic glycerol-3-phosphate dehydrogenase
MYVDNELTQERLDEIADNLRAEGYPYIGSAEHNRWELTEDGLIRHLWTDDNGVFVYDEDDVIETMEELEESYRAWYYDY